MLWCRKYFKKISFTIRIIIIIISSTALRGPWPSSEASASLSNRLLLLQIKWRVFSSVGLSAPRPQLGPRREISENCCLSACNFLTAVYWAQGYCWARVGLHAKCGYVCRWLSSVHLPVSHKACSCVQSTKFTRQATMIHHSVIDRFHAVNHELPVVFALRNSKRFITKENSHRIS
jgi:hypothetical protein